MQWMMLQQDKPEDYVIATGVQCSVRDFVQMSAGMLGISIRFEGEGIEEIGIVDSVGGSDAPAVRPGDVIIRVSPQYFRPAEVETLLGDAAKAAEKIGWKPEMRLEDLCSEMIAADLLNAKKELLLKSYDTNKSI
jgi:GDPmannose 4,6-dehydratase